MPRTPAPPHPGRILLEEHLEPREMTQSELALRLGVPFPRVNEIIRGRRGITADTALRLEAVLDTPAEEWMAMQSAWELWRAREEARRSAASGPRRGQRRRGPDLDLMPPPTVAPKADPDPVPEPAPALLPEPSGTGEAAGVPETGKESGPGEEPEAPPFQQLELL